MAHHCFASVESVMAKELESTSLSNFCLHAFKFDDGRKEKNQKEHEEMTGANASTLTQELLIEIVIFCLLKESTEKNQILVPKCFVHECTGAHNALPFLTVLKDHFF